MGLKTLRPESVPAIGLHDAVAGLGVSGEAGPVTVTGVCLDSRMVRPGDLYVALPGFHAHGAGFTTQAVERGAVAVLTDPEGARVVEDAGVPVLISHRLRPVMAEVSARVYGEPASGLELFGVTGTNGKTTTVALLEATLAAIGRRVGTIGTLGFRLDGRTLPSGRSTITTPDSPDLQALLALMRERGAHAVAIEVSSHAMAMSRADALKFEVAAFLNLGRDHLDFHHNMEEYFEAKASLFTPEHAREAVVWIDDEYGRRIADRAQRAGLPTVTVGTCEEADYRLAGYEPVLPLGGRAQLRTASGEVTVELALPGWHNMVDAAIAVAMLERAGIPAGTTLPGLARAQVPGRMQVLPLPEKAPTVIVDFAHTPDAMELALEAVRPITPGRLIVVFGSDGDRDQGKRPMLGEVCARLADVLVVTDENPRSEDPQLIRNAILDGVRSVRPDLENVEEITTWRGDAVRRGVELCGPDDTVIVTGKGHEPFLEMAGDFIRYNDAPVMAEAVEEKWGRG